MSEQQKLFIVSDIHGHYKELKKALNEAGFDENRDDHHLLGLGDYFDRGTENKEVYEYAHGLDKKGKGTFLIGNHDLFLLEFFEEQDDRVLFNIDYNGFQTTLESFSGIPYEGPESLPLMRKLINEAYPKLQTWLESLPSFIERGPYIFVHGGIDGANPYWRQQNRRDYAWNYQSQLPGVKGKTVVAGHERTPFIRLREDRTQTFDEQELSGILKKDGKIFIDGYVEQTGRINVYTVTIEDPL